MKLYIKASSDGVTSYGEVTMSPTSNAAATVHFEDFSNIASVDRHTLYTDEDYENGTYHRTLGSDRGQFYAALCDFLIDFGHIRDSDDHIDFWWSEQPENDLIVDCMGNGFQWSVHVPGSYVWGQIDSHPQEIDYAAEIVMHYIHDSIRSSEDE